MQTEKEIYQEIIKRFPSGRLAAHLLNSQEIDLDEVIRQLEAFTRGHDSDRQYTDEQSKKDAQNFIDRLKSL